MTANERNRSTKRPPTSNVGATLLGATALVVVTVAVSWFAIGALYGGCVGCGSQATPQASTTTSTSSSPVHVYLTIVNTAAGADQYLPANFTVPVNTQVDFQITNYDNGANNLSGPFWNVSGTNGGTETINGGMPGTPQGAVSQLPYGFASHTFTIPSGPQTLNVVMPPAASTTDPAVVTFSVTFTTSGTYNWNCMAPCDPASMATPGFMAGTITVV